MGWHGVWVLAVALIVEGFAQKRLEVGIAFALRIKIGQCDDGGNVTRFAGQRFERGVEVQAPKRAKSEFVFAGRRTGLVRLRQRWLEQFASHRIVILAETIKRSRHNDTRRTPSASPISCPLY